MKGPTEKSIQTRKKIYESAIKLFQKKGFEETTLRTIAMETKVSLGLTYYHFKSKEEIVMEFYKNTLADSEIECEEFFKIEKRILPRMQFVLKQKLEQFHPYKNFLHILAKSAGDPNHPLSPFSFQTKEIRESAIQIIAKAINHSDEKIPEDIEKVLPEILWFYQMGIVYFWLSDNSNEKVNSFNLIDSSLEIVFQMLKISKLPFMKPIRKKILELHSFIANQ